MYEVKSFKINLGQPRVAHTQNEFHFVKSEANYRTYPLLQIFLCGIKAVVTLRGLKYEENSLEERPKVENTLMEAMLIWDLGHACNVTSVTRRLSERVTNAP